MSDYMKEFELPRVLIGAASSGSGKTTIVCGILMALLDRGKKVVSFKCGPDYIDPMFHKEVIGIESRNLDLFFQDANGVKYLIAKNAVGKDMAVIEGVMGYYDGIGGKSYGASSYELSVKTGTPTILVVDAKGKSMSILAEIKGFTSLEEDSNIKGVILNRISPAIYGEIKELIENRLGIKVLGYMPVLKDSVIESRHLGLITAKEILNLNEILEGIKEQTIKTIDIDGILEIGKSAESMKYEENEFVKSKKQQENKYASMNKVNGVRIGIARDEAFCFYYEDNLQLLRDLGAEIVEFSPIHDGNILDYNLDGLYLGGGYPELYLNQLSQNDIMRESLKCAMKDGIPTIAECGGFMYLHEFIRDKEGCCYPMVGVIRGESFYGDKLVRFGYTELTAKEDNLLCKKGEVLKSHEFHYFDSTNTGSSFAAKKPCRDKVWEAVIGTENFYGGYPHIYFYSNLQSAERFIEACHKYKK